MPLALLATILMAVAAGAIAWSHSAAAIDTAQAATSRNTEDITVLNQKVANDHDVLIEIRGDVKRLLREENRRP